MRISSTSTSFSFLPGLALVVVLGYGQAPGQRLVDASGPDLSSGPQAVAGVLVESHRGHLHRRDLQHRDRDLDLLASGGAGLAVVDHHSVRHAGLVAGKSLYLRAFADLGPVVQFRCLSRSSLSWRIRHGALSRTSFVRHMSPSLLAERAHSLFLLTPILTSVEVRTFDRDSDVAPQNLIGWRLRVARALPKESGRTSLSR